MDMPEPRLLTIGEFSRLSMLSIRMLRHYDEHDVLRPTWVDPSSGYRCYDPGLLRPAARIRVLRDAGASVAVLASCAPFDDETRLREVLLECRDAALAEATAAASRVREINRCLEEWEHPVMSTTITRTTIPARLVASLRGTIPSYADEGQLWQQLSDGLASTHTPAAADAKAVAVFHDDGYVEHDVDVEVQLDVVGPFTGAGPVQCVEIPALDVAVGELLGSYDGVGSVMADLGEWIAKEGLRVAGPMFNIYLVGPAISEDPSTWVTQVCLPVA